MIGLKIAAEFFLKVMRFEKNSKGVTPASAAISITLSVLSSMLIIFSAQSSLAQESEDPPYCQDLAAFTCNTLGPFDEGMGRTEMPGQKKTDAIVSFVRTSARAFFAEKFVNDPSYAAWARVKVSPTASADETLDKLSELSVEEIVTWKMYEQTHEHLSSEQIIALKKMFDAETRTYFPNEIVRFKELLKDQLARSSYATEVEGRLQEIKSAYSKMLGQIKGKSLRSKLRLKIDRIVAVKDCDMGTGMKSDLTGVLTTNLFYNAQPNSFEACRGMSVFSTTYFGAVFDIAHEVGHSIDPCSVGTPYKVDGNDNHLEVSFNYPKNSDAATAVAAYPFSKTLKCLMSPSSIGAKDEGSPSETDSSPFCRASASQLLEAQADFFALDILLDVLQEKLKREKRVLTPLQYAMGFANTFRSFCGDNFYKSGLDHPAPADRLNRMILAHPEVRRLMNCKQPLRDVRYCG